MRWREAHPGGIVPRGRIQPFLFDYATLETGSTLEGWVRWANSLLVLNLAPITLGLLLWRYTDRQEAWVTIWHYLAFLFDSYLVWKLRVALWLNRQFVNAEPAVPEWLSPVWAAPAFLRGIPRHGLRGGFGLFLLAETVFTVAVAELPSNVFLTYCLPLARRVEKFQEKIALLPGVASLLLPRIAIDPGETVWAPDPKSLEVEAKMAGEADWVKYFNEKGAGFRPATKNLRLIQLQNQRLPRANLEYAQLEGANLPGIQLQNANLSYIQLQGANLWSALLQGSELRLAHLQGANLIRARLQGANLNYAELQGTIFRGAELQGAKLISAQLQGASLQSARLQGANLEFAQLQGSNLYHTQLNGASLKDAKIQGAILGRTAISGITAPEMARVFLITPPFDLTVDWKNTENLADTLHKPLRDDFIKRIREAKTKKDKSFKAAFHHDPSAIYREVLPSWCKSDESLQSRVVAIRGVRWHYSPFAESWYLDPPPELQSTLTAIDRTLCTLPACADLKDDIEGLDCGRFTAMKPQPGSKQ